MNTKIVANVYKVALNYTIFPWFRIEWIDIKVTTLKIQHTSLLHRTKRTNEQKKTQRNFVERISCLVNENCIRGYYCMSGISITIRRTWKSIFNRLEKCIANSYKRKLAIEHRTKIAWNKFFFIFSLFLFYWIMNWQLCCIISLWIQFSSQNETENRFSGNFRPFSPMK